MGEILDITGLLSLRATLQAADFVAPVGAEQQALDAWNERLDSTSPFTRDLTELVGLAATAPAGVDSYTIGLLRGVIDARSGATAATENEDQDYLRGYRQGAASLRPMALAAVTA